MQHGVARMRVRAFTSAPPRASARSTARWPSCAATKSAVAPPAFARSSSSRARREQALDDAQVARARGDDERARAAVARVRAAARVDRAHARGLGGEVRRDRVRVAAERGEEHGVRLVGLADNLAAAVGRGQDAPDGRADHATDEVGHRGVGTDA